MTDRLAELGALQYAVENLSTAATNPNRLGLAGYIHAAYTDYQVWAAANPGVNPNRLSARGRIYGYFYDNASWSPSSLFANSEVGAWFDPSDLTTMFQDSAGTTLVTADGQPVGKILDKSGRGNHASQATAASRPLYKTDGTYHWLQFDGVDDSLSTAGNIGLLSAPIFSCYGILSQNILSGQTAFYNDRYKSSLASSKNRFTLLGVVDYDSAGPTLLSNDRYVLSQYFDSLFDCTFRANSANQNTVVGANDGVNPEVALIIGSVAGGLYLNGNIYSLIIRGALSTTQEITDTETWVNQRTGAY